MRIIHCPDGEDPPAYARRVLKRRGGGFNLREKWWIVAIAIFLVVTFTVGPLKPKKTVEIAPDAAPATVEIANNTALTRAENFDGFCKNPAGGLIAPGDVAWLQSGDDYKQVRCMENGTLEEIEAP